MLYALTYRQGIHRQQTLPLVYQPLYVILDIIAEQNLVEIDAVL